MSTTIAALAANGISIAEANAWVISNLSNPTLIFNTAKSFSLTSEDLASIVAVSVPDVDATLVETFFDSLGFDSSELTTPSNETVETPEDIVEEPVVETPASTPDPVLSDALIHELIQAKVDFEDTRGVEILALAAAADITSNYDGEVVILQGQAGYDEFIANYTRLDLEDEADLVRGDNTSYSQTFAAWDSEFSSVQNAVKAYYDDVIRLEFDLGFTLDLADDNSDSYYTNNDLIIFDTQANENTIESFSSNDDIYIFDGKAHFLGTTGGTIVNSVVNWALSNSHELSSNVTDYFVIDDGLNTYILAEKVANQGYSNAMDAGDFTILTLIGVDASDLGYDDGMIAYA